MAHLCGLLALALGLGTNPFLDEGRQLYKRQQYRPAEARLRLALDVPTNTDDERREASALLAQALLAQGRTHESEEVFEHLLAADPNAPAPKGSPKVQTAFRNAKAHLFPAGYVGLTRQASGPEALELKVVDPWGSVAVVKLWERQGDGAFQPRALALDGGRVRATFATLTGAYVEALGPDGKALASAGTAEEPLVVGPPPRPAPEPELIPPVTPAAVVPAAALPSAAVEAVPPHRTAHRAGALTLAAGGAGFVTGAVLYGVGNSQYQSAQSSTGFASDRYPQAVSGRNLALAGDLTMAVSAAFVLAGGVLLTR